MGEYNVGEIVNVSEVHLNRFEIKNVEAEPVAATKLKIIEVPSKGKPVAVVYERGDRTGADNDLLDGHL
jgi:hypothetical protein